MSRSNNTEIRNPAKKFFEWDGENGGFRYYDKDKIHAKGEKGERVHVPLPFKFLVLDTLSTIKGYSDADKSGYWCNEVRDLQTEIMTVKNKKGICAKGLYADVINDRNCTGSKYSQSVYIGYFEDKQLVICNIQIVGAALGAWIDFRKKAKIYEGAVCVPEMVEGTKGKNVYKIPVFKMFASSKETEEKAKELDKELQKHLFNYFAKNKPEVQEQIVEHTSELHQENVPEEIGMESFPGDINEAPF